MRAESSWWSGRSGLVVPAVVAAFSTYLLVGTLTMEIPEGTDFPGPTFYPLILVVAGYVLSALLVVAIVPASLAQRWRSGGE